MFIKIEDSNSGYTRESTFHCVRYSLWNMEHKDEKEDRIMLEIRGNTEMDIELIKNDKTKVYIMNDDGKTIDRIGPWG